MYDTVPGIVCIIIYNNLFENWSKMRTFNIIMPIQDDKMQDIFYILCTCSMQ